KRKAIKANTAAAATQELSVQKIIRLDDGDGGSAATASNQTTPVRRDMIMTIQPVKIIERPFLELDKISSKSRRMRTAIQEWPHFAETITQNNNNNNMTTFLENVRNQDDNLRLVMDNELSLLHDFQVMVTVQGTVIHYDLDRAFKHRHDTKPYLKKSKRLNVTKAILFIIQKEQEKLEAGNSSSYDGYDSYDA
ncbi:MAG: hypothetical protein SGARI_007113, partial [Bacillariaceae sp.]